MIEESIARRGITDSRLLDAFRAVPREAFVSPEQESVAYEDRPLGIGRGQTISQPYIVAATIEALALRGDERVLDVGTGSGYAAAILGKLTREVHSIERIEELARAAETRLAEVGAKNVRVHVGDGTLGLPAHAPFDAIAVAASGPVIPQSLVEQLAIGGRLVMPVTSPEGIGQVLVRVHRVAEHAFVKEELGEVQFVPLLGAQGHRPGEMAVVTAPRLARPGSATSAALVVRDAAEPLDGIEGTSIGPLVERIASARIVMLGESTHGTSEFYRLRARITRELVTKHGFDFVAVEGDWPDAARVNDYVAHASAPHTTMPFTPFDRFPQWMWRNREVVDFVEWLRAHNARSSRRSVGFFGLDLYSMYTSIGVVLRYLAEVDPHAAGIARERYRRLLPKGEEGLERLLPARRRLDVAEEAVLANLRDLLRNRLEYMERGPERYFDAAQNARVVASAERYYRAVYRGAAESWNLRDSHMFDTLRLLLAHFGGSSKAIVWAHNSHVGDARATEMRVRREHNIGQLARQAFGDAVRLVGFGTHHGTVAAADDWDEPMRVKIVRPGHPESYEHVMHETGIAAFVLALRSPARVAVREELEPARLFRAIGVVYRPQTELASHYLEVVLPEQLDELVWVDETRAVTPLETLPTSELAKLPETYPFGL